MARERDEPFQQALRELGYVASMQYTLRMHMDLVDCYDTRLVKERSNMPTLTSRFSSF
jgi:hypothetical protein